MSESCNDNDNDNGAACKPGRLGAGSGRDDAGAAIPDAGAEQRPRGPDDYGRYIMLACAARREMRGRVAALSPPEDMFTYKSSYGLPGPWVRRRRDDGSRGEARTR